MMHASRQQSTMNESGHFIHNRLSRGQLKDDRQESERGQLRTPLTSVRSMAVTYMIAIPVNMPAATCTRRVAV